MLNPAIQVVTDKGYEGIRKIHSNSKPPIKRSKRNPLPKHDKAQNREISLERILNENVMSLINRFKIISDRYRNRRKRFGLMCNLIAGIHNYEIINWFRKRSNVYCHHMNFLKNRISVNYLK